MEWKIGEIKQIKGEWYQCVKGESEEKCTGCFFKSSPICIDLNCLGNERKDHTKVIFKKLEKVGEPYPNADKLYQLYILPMNIEKLPTHTEGINLVRFDIVEIEIKQNKEDMEEKKSAMDFVVTPPRLTGDKPEHQLNLKSFDLQKAKEGKPVCTRDGRKARIICFDAKDTQPIIGLYEKDIDGIVREYLCSYHMDGRMYDDHDCGYDLMMLPEKKEGWINIIKTEDGVYCCKGELHSDYNDAFIENINVLDNRGITVRIEWEE